VSKALQNAEDAGWLMEKALWFSPTSLRVLNLSFNILLPIEVKKFILVVDKCARPKPEQFYNIIFLT